LDDDAATTMLLFDSRSLYLIRISIIARSDSFSPFATRPRPIVRSESSGRMNEYGYEYYWLCHRLPERSSVKVGRKGEGEGQGTGGGYYLSRSKKPGVGQVHSGPEVPRCGAAYRAFQEAFRSVPKRIRPLRIPRLIRSFLSETRGDNAGTRTRRSRSNRRSFPESSVNYARRCLRADVSLRGRLRNAYECTKR